MFIFRKIKYFILSLVVLLVIGVGAGVSFWVFANNGFNGAINSGSNIDNIEENYTFGRDSITDTYDIYFYPSSYYLYYYASKKVYPENAFGYLNYDFLTEKYDYINSSEDEFLKSANDASEAYCNAIDGKNDEDLDKYIEGHWDWGYHSYEETLGTFLGIKIGENSLKYKGEWTGDNVSRGVEINIIKDENVINVNKNSSFNDLGNIEEDLADVNPDFLTSKININEEIGTLFKTFEKNDPAFQTLNLDDRIGYWYDLNPNEGRYLPKKVTFTSSTNFSIINDIIGTPYNDMGDTSGWHNLEFSNWIYVNEYNLNQYENYKPVDGFAYKEQGNIFDPTSDLRKYADKNKSSDGHYVIRLFPVFSNGKNYNNGGVIKNGNRDGFRLDYLSTINIGEGENTTSYYNLNTRYFDFLSGSQSDANGTNLDFAMISNFKINLNDNESYTGKLRLSGTRIYSNGTEYSGGREGLWTTFNITNDIDFLNKTYNIYIFETKNTYNSENSAKNELNEIIKDLQLLLMFLGLENILTLMKV